MSDKSLTVKQKNQLPTLADLYEEKGLALREKENALNVILNQPPKPEWVRTNKLANNSLYLPIERVEYLLTRLFQKWRVEIKGEPKLIANAVVVVVRLHYWDIASGEWNWQDGVGAHNLQVDKDCNPTDLNALKANAVNMSTPIAETEAIKDAAHKIGKIFGKDLNRKDSANYDMLLGTFDTPEKKIQDIELKIIKGFASYTGTDKQKLFDEYKHAKANGKFNEIYANILANKIGVTL